MTRIDMPTGPNDGRTSAMRGTNQSGVRVHNEKLVLSMLRRDGPIAKAEIARRTGLSAQTVSVIMRTLEDDETILRDAPQRGRVGQPSVPMRLNPDGAFFFGLTIGRRMVELVLVDLTGEIREREHILCGHPDFDEVLEFVARGTQSLSARLPSRLRRRVGGLGIAMPFQIWDWAAPLGVSPEALSDWRERDIGEEIAARTGLAVETRNDASAACGAELVFGTDARLPSTFLHIYVGVFVGGGLVVNDRLYTGPTGNAGAIGSLPVLGPDGTPGQLVQWASLNALARALDAGGRGGMRLWTADDWSFAEPELDAWIDVAAPTLAQAVVATTAIMDIEVALIDGQMPPETRMRLVERIDRALDACDFAGIARPHVREGTLGADAPSLGAASLPLAWRFLV